MFWVYSPALDLLKIYKDFFKLEGKTELNILVAGSSDARHILKTLSKYNTHEDEQNITIHFFIVGVIIEFLAREMLFTLIALEPSEKIGLKGKANLWMEFFGNSLLRSTTAEYIGKKAYQLIKIITNINFKLKRIPCLILNNLKYKEKECLENIFKFWMENKVSKAVNWDNRVRNHDSKMGVFDWDYFMILKDIKDGDKINYRKFKHWRNTGVAFTWIEKEYSVSNPTLVVGTEAVGDKLQSLNYLGDITSGPFYCFSTECEYNEMLKVVNEVRIKCAAVGAERNIMRMFYEIENNNKYIYGGSIDRDLGAAILQMAELKLEVSTINIKYVKTEDDYTSFTYYT